jgi:hypothetical protein
MNVAPSAAVPKPTNRSESCPAVKSWMTSPAKSAPNTNDRGKHRIGARAEIFEHEVAGVIHEVDVIAGVAAHDVGAGAAVEEVAPGIAIELVRLAIAVALQGGAAALQDQRPHVFGQPQVGCRKHRIGALAGILDQNVAAVVNEIGVVAGATKPRVGSGVAVEDIVAGVAVDRVFRELP